MKKKLWLASIFSLIVLSLIIVNTYSLFETNTGGTSLFSVGKWVILLNEADISLSREITIDDFSYTGDQHIENGYFAPGGTATLELTIDATNTDVALEYEIDFDTTPIVDYPNMTLTITNLDTNQVMNGSNYTGTMYLDDDREINILLSLIWENDDDYDETDSELIDNPISFTMNINFSQLIDEE